MQSKNFNVSPYSSPMSKGGVRRGSTKEVWRPHVQTSMLDTAAALVAGDSGELDPAEAVKIRRKIDLHIMPLMCILYWIQFMDKTTLGLCRVLQECVRINTGRQAHLRLWVLCNPRI